MEGNMRVLGGLMRRLPVVSFIGSLGPVGNWPDPI